MTGREIPPILGKNEVMDLLYETGYSSPLGPMILESDGEALTGLRFGETDRRSVLPLWKEVEDWLDAYFAGRAPEPAPVPLKPRGTEFQQAVWALLRQIPRGTTVTYGSLAARLGPSMSPQAVGQAVGKNPIAIVIPCHRVVGRAGLTGYAWGLEKKRYLLEHEKIGAD